MLDKYITKIKLAGKSEEKQRQTASMMETEEHLKRAYKECEPIIIKDVHKGLKCICSKLQRKQWLHESGIELGTKLYGMEK